MFGLKICIPIHYSKLENVQNRFLKSLTNKLNFPFSKNTINLLQESLAFDSLSTRRDLADIMFIFDILNGYVLCPGLLTMLGFRILLLFTCNRDLFVIPHYRTNSVYRSILFSPQSSSISQYNLLYTRFFF